MAQRNISKAVIARLPRYYRYLGYLIEERTERISSGELSRHMHVTASQIRQDLNNFGGFGQQGYGYNVKYLYGEIGRLLGLEETYQMIIIGAGNLGQALANYVRFEKRGFRIIGLFDSNPAIEGRVVRDVPVRMVHELDGFLRENKVDIAALTLPAAGAVQVLPVIVRNGIKAIWNFAHTDLEVPEDVIVENVHLSESLMQLSYRLHTARTEAAECAEEIKKADTTEKTGTAEMTKMAEMTETTKTAEQTRMPVQAGRKVGNGAQD